MNSGLVDLRRLPAGAGLLLALCALLAWQGWQCFGPVPEQPVEPQMEVRQWSAATCGPAAIATVLNAYGRPWAPDDLEQLCRVDPRGSSLHDLAEAVRAHGLSARGLQAQSAEALYRVPRPFVAYVQPGHFLVVERRERDGFAVFDPTSGTVRPWSAAELFRRGDGWVLAVTPAAPRSATRPALAPGAG